MLQVVPPPDFTQAPPPSPAAAAAGTRAAEQEDEEALFRLLEAAPLGDTEPEEETGARHVRVLAFVREDVETDTDSAPNSALAVAVNTLALATDVMVRHGGSPRAILGSSNFERELIAKLLSVGPEIDEPIFARYYKCIRAEGPDGVRAVTGYCESMTSVYENMRAAYWQRLGLDPEHGHDFAEFFNPKLGRCLICNPRDADPKELNMSASGRAALARKHEDKDRLEPQLPLWPVTLLCNHRYCSNCIVQGALFTPDIFFCPGCREIHGSSFEHMQPAVPSFIPPSAYGVVDTMLVNRAKYGINMDTWLKMFPTRPVPLLLLDQRIRDPENRQLTVFFEKQIPFSWLSPQQRGVADALLRIFCVCGSAVRPILGGTWGRCTTGLCATLCCLHPTPHALHAKEGCLSSVQVGLADEDRKAMAIDTAKYCPKCGVPATHFFNHGCHHVTCTNPQCIEDGTPNTRTQFCWICGRPHYLSRRNAARNCTCGIYCGTRKAADGTVVTCGCAQCPDCPNCKICDGCPVCRAAQTRAPAAADATL
jgi:hypothetical protein